MKFAKGSTYHLVSDCGRYTVAKIIVAGEIHYEAWFKPERGQPIALANRKSSSLDCITECRLHDERNPEKKTA